MSFGDLDPEIKLFKKDQAGPLFTILKCVDAWMNAHVILYARML